MEEKTCNDCNGMCCKHVAIEIDTPETKEDFENIRWFVAHKNVKVYIDEDDLWHVEFSTPCEFFGENNQCKIYDKRPAICREYSQEECLFHNPYAEKYTFNSLDEIDDYMRGNI
jgi:Fe-S-cluster containining protein